MKIDCIIITTNFMVTARLASGVVSTWLKPKIYSFARIYSHAGIALPRTFVSRGFSQ